ncbi:hypothetical protein GCM10010434_013660 [Winogradskya humida]
MEDVVRHMPHSARRTQAGRSRPPSSPAGVLTLLPTAREPSAGIANTAGASPAPHPRRRGAWSPLSDAASGCATRPPRAPHLHLSISTSGRLLYRKVQKIYSGDSRKYAVTGLT